MQQRITVILRLRPLVGKESENIWVINDQEIQVAPTKRINTYQNITFQFPQIMQPIQTTLELFNQNLQQISQNVVDGINSTLLAYGQSSAGKTYTMFGSSQSKGLIELILTDIFEKVKGTQFLVKMQFIELYNEVLIDLLQPGKKRPEIREDQGQILLQNVEEPKVTSYDECLKLILQGQKNRTTSETNLNEQSSRSHAILRIVLEQADMPSLPTKRKTFRVNKSSVLTLVDLAGSEKQNKTNAQGARLNEANNINKSLLVLGRVINALCGKDQFVPYRESNLTRLLQNSLGGNAVSYIIGCISPATEHIDESINTMRFCQRAMDVKNKPKVNEFYSDAEKLERALLQNKQLKVKIKELEDQLGVCSASIANMTTLSISELESNQASKISISELSIDQLNEPIQKIGPPDLKAHESDLEKQIAELKQLLEQKDLDSQKQLAKLRQRIEDNSTDQILLVTQKYQEDFDQQHKLDQRRIDDLLLMVETLQKNLNDYLEIETRDAEIQLDMSKLQQIEHFTEVGQSLIEFCMAEFQAQKDVSVTDKTCQNSDEFVSDGVQAGSECADEAMSVAIGCSISQHSAEMQTSAQGADDFVQTSCIETQQLTADPELQIAESQRSESDAAQVGQSLFCQPIDRSMETSRALLVDKLVQPECNGEDRHMQTSSCAADNAAQYSFLGTAHDVQTSEVRQSTRDMQTSRGKDQDCQNSTRTAHSECAQTSAAAFASVAGQTSVLDHQLHDKMSQLHSSNVSGRNFETALADKPCTNASPLRSSPLRRMQKSEDLADRRSANELNEIFAHFAMRTDDKTADLGVGMLTTEILCGALPETVVLARTAAYGDVCQTQTSPIPKPCFPQQDVGARDTQISCSHADAETQCLAVLASFQGQTEAPECRSFGEQFSGDLRSFTAQKEDPGQREEKSVFFCGNNSAFCVQACEATEFRDEEQQFQGDATSVAVQDSLQTECRDEAELFLGDVEDKEVATEAQRDSEDKSALFIGDCSARECQTAVWEVETKETQTAAFQEAAAQTDPHELAELATACLLVAEQETQTQSAGQDVETQAGVENCQKALQTEPSTCSNCQFLERRLRDEVASQKQQFSTKNDEVQLLQQQNQNLQVFVADQDVLLSALRAENAKYKAEIEALTAKSEHSAAEVASLQEQLSVLRPPLLCSFNMQTDVADISKSIQAYTSLMMSDISSSLTAGNSAQFADAGTEMTAVLVSGEDYRAKYLDLEEKFNRLIGDSREKIQLVMESAKKREEHLLEKVREQLTEMKKYKDIVLQMQEKSALCQKMRIQQQLVGMQAPKQSE